MSTNIQRLWLHKPGTHLSYIAALLHELWCNCSCYCLQPFHKKIIIIIIIQLLYSKAMYPIVFLFFQIGKELLMTVIFIVKFKE